MHPCYRLLAALPFSLLSIVTGATAQTPDVRPHVFKGRIIGIPTSGTVYYSFGAGYERILGGHFSVQVLLNSYGLDGHAYDMGAENYTNLVPEVKYYFNKVDKLSSSLYLAGFVEMQVNTVTPGGERDGTEPFLLKITGRALQPGILLGKNFKFSERWHLETYIGPKYRLIRYFEQYRLNGQRLRRTVDSSELFAKPWGVRFGVNLAHCF